MWAETRPHEAGFGSNRVSQARGEYVPAPCTHRPSKHPSEVRMRPGLPGRIWASQGGLSRNKVAVGESAAGSPPQTRDQDAVLAHLAVLVALVVSTRHLRTIGARVRPGWYSSGFDSLQVTAVPRFEPLPLSGSRGDDRYTRSMHHPARAGMGRVDVRSRGTHGTCDDDRMYVQSRHPLNPIHRVHWVPLSIGYCASW